MMSLTPAEESAVNFMASKLLGIAREMPCRDAAKLLRGFLSVTDESAFPEVRDLFNRLRECEQQLDLLAQPQCRLFGHDGDKP